MDVICHGDGDTVKMRLNWSAFCPVVDREIQDHVLMQHQMWERIIKPHIHQNQHTPCRHNVDCLHLPHQPPPVWSSSSLKPSNQTQMLGLQSPSHFCFSLPLPPFLQLPIAFFSITLHVPFSSLHYKSGPNQTALSRARLPCLLCCTESCRQLFTYDLFTYRTSLESVVTSLESTDLRTTKWIVIVMGVLLVFMGETHAQNPRKHSVAAIKCGIVS